MLKKTSVHRLPPVERNSETPVVVKWIIKINQLVQQLVIFIFKFLILYLKNRLFFETTKPLI